MICELRFTVPALDEGCQTAAELLRRWVSSAQTIKELDQVHSKESCIPSVTCKLEPCCTHTRICVYRMARPGVENYGIQEQFSQNIFIFALKAWCHASRQCHMLTLHYQPQKKGGETHPIKVTNLYVCPGRHLKRVSQPQRPRKRS